MGKPFAKELNQIGDTIEWAKKRDVLKIRQYLTERPWLNMVCVGSIPQKRHYEDYAGDIR